MKEIGIKTVPPFPMLFVPHVSSACIAQKVKRHKDIYVLTESRYGGHRHGP